MLAAWPSGGAGRPPTLRSVAVTALALAALLYRHGLHLPQLRLGGEYLNFPGIRADLAAESPAVEFVKRAASDPVRVASTARCTRFADVYGTEESTGPTPS